MTGDARIAPVFLSPGDRLITVFGGGKVAHRKCLNFEGFRIKVVAGEINPEVRALAEITVIADIDENVVRANLDGAFMVMAATSDKALNMMICDVCREAGVPVNSAHGGGDVLIPSVLRKRNYTVTVSSEGKVPAFPPYVVEVLDKLLDESYDDMMDILYGIRPMMMDRIKTQPERAEFLAKAVRDPEIWALIRSGRKEDAKTLLMKKGGLQ